MKRSLSSTLAIVPLGVVPSLAQDAFTARVDDYVKTEMQKQRIPGISLAVIKNGQVILAKGYGLANVEHQVPAKPETIFQSGSVGKQFTAAKEGKIAGLRFLRVYDFKRAYDETKGDGIRENMKAETGMTEVAIKERSSILQMEKLRSPILIIHGENDGNAPTNQALLLRDRLNQLKKDFEIRILRDHKHGLFKSDFLLLVVDFLSRKLKGEPVTTL